MKKFIATAAVLVLSIIFGSNLAASDLKVCLDEPSVTTAITPDIEPPVVPEGDEDIYVGTVRVYLVEPFSRWRDDDGYSYRNGFLSFPIVANVNLFDGDTRYLTSTWDASTTSLQDISESNIEAIGVVFNVTGIPTESDPGNGQWFSARYADAAAGAIPGYPGQNNTTTAGFTHTVFVEESTTTW